MTIHPLFRLNGQCITNDVLIDIAYSLIKEGDDDDREIGNFLMDWLSVSETITVNTSGSTGAPKSIKLQKAHMIKSALVTGVYFGLREGDRALLCLPVKYIAGKMMLVRAMVLGLWLDIVPPSSTPLQFISKTYDFCAMVPLQVANSINKIGHLKKLIVGGAPLSQALKEELNDKTTQVYETYGMTETITHIAVKAIDNDHFEVLPHVRISKDERECLIIDAPDIGCKNLITNDLIKLIDDSHFKWLGRFDHVINTGGIKILAEELEDKLNHIIDIPFFVAGMPHHELGEKLVLLVQGRVDENQLVQKIKALNNVSKHERPKAIVRLPKFIFTGNKKINRGATIALLNKK